MEDIRNKYFILEDDMGNQYVEYATSDTQALEQAEEKWPTVTFVRITFHGTNPPLWYKQSNKENKMNTNTQAGFTLIELMIVIVIISIIGALVLSNFDIIGTLLGAVTFVVFVLVGCAISAGYSSVKSIKQKMDNTMSFTPNNNKKGN